MTNDNPTFVRIPWPATYVAASGDEPPEGKDEVIAAVDAVLRLAQETSHD